MFYAYEPLLTTNGVTPQPYAAVQFFAADDAAYRYPLQVFGMDEQPLKDAFAPRADIRGYINNAGGFKLEVAEAVAKSPGLPAKPIYSVRSIIADARAARTEAAEGAALALATRIAAGEFKGKDGAPGAPGVPGVNAIPAAEAMATAAQTLGNPLNTALSATIVGEATAPTGYDVILLAGQSNMSGRGVGHTAATDPTHPMIFQLKGKTPNKGTVIPAAEPLDMVDAPSGIGPGLQFARWYVSEGMNRGRKVLLVPVAQGGTPLARVATPTWKPSVAGSLYSNAIAQAQAALALPGSKLVAILWLQGETDGDLNVTGADYQADLDALISGFRTALSAPQVPFILGQMVPDYLNIGTRAAINAVHAATPTRIPYTGFSFSPSGPANHLGDNNHFNAAGQRLIAKGMFQTFQRVSTGLPVETAATASAAPLRTLGTLVRPSQAYSLRRTVESYTGPLIRVRRADASEQDISMTAVKALDTAALLAFAGSGDATVVTWYDQSGNGRHVTQPDANKQPKVVEAGVVVLSGTRPAVKFDGADDHLFNTTPVLWAAGQATVCGVIRATSAAQSRWWTESTITSAGQQYGLLQSDGNTVERNPMAFPVMTDGLTVNTVAPAPKVPIFNGAIHQGTSLDTGASISQWVDGASDALDIPYTRPVSTKDRFTIGGVVRAGSLAPLAMTLSEVIFWPTTLGYGDRRTIEESQKTFYGTP